MTGAVALEPDANISPRRMLLKTTDYLDHFARFKRKENVEAVERLLSAHKELAKFERAQLGMSPSYQQPGNIRISC
jgi:hypothetical protein